MAATKTIFTKQDNFIGDVLANLDLIKRAKIEIRFSWTNVGNQYYYYGSNLSKVMLIKMLEQNEFNDHLWYKDIRTFKLVPLTKEVLTSLEFMGVHESGFLVSGIFIESQEALAQILKEMMGSSFIKKK